MGLSEAPLTLVTAVSKVGTKSLSVCPLERPLSVSAVNAKASLNCLWNLSIRNLDTDAQMLTLDEKHWNWN